MRSRSQKAVTPRVARSAQQRRELASSQLTRIRNRHAEAPRLRWPVRSVSVFLLLGSAAIGAALTSPVGSRLLRAEGAVVLEAVHVRGALHLRPADVVAASALERGSVSHRESAADIASRVTSHPWIASARAVWLSNGTLLIEIEERSPAARVAAAGAETDWFVDATGNAFAPADAATAGLPLLRSAAPLAPGMPDAQLAAALAISNQIAAAGLPDGIVVVVTAEGDLDGFTLEVPGIPGRVVLGLHEPAAQRARLRKLAFLLAAELPEVQRASRIDLRFADQAVLQTSHSQGAATAAPGRGHAAASNGMPTG